MCKYVINYVYLKQKSAACL